MKSCKCNEHAQGNTVLISSSRTAEGHLYTTTYDSSLTLWPSDTVCVARTWLNFLLCPIKLAASVLPGVHGYSLSLEDGGVCLRVQCCLKAC